MQREALPIAMGQLAPGKPRSALRYHIHIDAPAPLPEPRSLPISPVLLPTEADFGGHSENEMMLKTTELAIDRAGTDIEVPDTPDRADLQWLCAQLGEVAG